MRGWRHIDNFGESLKIVGKGNLRRLINKKGETIVEYSIDN